MMITTPEIEKNVVGMYEQHPFPSIEDKGEKSEAEMAFRLQILGIKPEDYVGKKVLDAGCGTGEYSCWYARRGSRITAVDLSEPSLRIAAQYAKKEKLENITFEKQSILKLDYPDATFDYVYSMGVLHHTPDPYAGFCELCRVLRPNGVILVSLYNKYGRLRHNIKQLIVRSLAREDTDRRVAWAKRLFPRTCRSLQRNRGDDSEIILYDAFGIPHESQHAAGEILDWFSREEIDYMGAFGPLTVRENLLALRLLQHNEFVGFKRFFQGFPIAAWAVDSLPRIVNLFPSGKVQKNQDFRHPPWVSRGLVQFLWFMLGFRFSIFSLSGRKK